MQAMSNGYFFFFLSLLMALMARPGSFRVGGA
jgi:hypothetical protein